MRLRAARLSPWAIGLGAVLFACGAERQVHPPPEGEWLEWQPKASEREQPRPIEEPAAPKKAAKPRDRTDDAEDLDAPAPKTKPVAPTVKCTGRDVTRESVCVTLSELAAKHCPAKLPRRPDAPEAGMFEEQPTRAKRDPSLEASANQCCYAWCGKIPSAPPPVPCESPEPLFCFEAPTSTQNAAPPPYAECPMGLKKTKGKGHQRATPNAVFSSKLTKQHRSSEAKTCCYEACK